MMIWEDKVLGEIQCPQDDCDEYMAREEIPDHTLQELCVELDDGGSVIGPQVKV